ncbi:MAG: elongation factor G [Leptospiraceae bacterium]|nr:elongation factor G [Leptospiraceae bacterium]
MKKLRNIGISAHIDAGKTTLSERILFYAGRIHRMHEIRSEVGATLDSDPIEKRKGITIRSAATRLNWSEHTIQLVDTPGHVDFTIEVERTLRVMEGAILVVCAVGGVQPQTIHIDRQMRRYSVSRIAYINKLDRPGADYLRVVSELRNQLGMPAQLLQVLVSRADGPSGLLDLVAPALITFEGEYGEHVVRHPVDVELREVLRANRIRLIESLAELDDSIADLYLKEVEPSSDELQSAIRRQVLRHRFVPVFLGSALQNFGVQPLLDGVCAYLPGPEDRSVELTRLNDGPEGTEKKYAERDDRVMASADVNAPFVAYVFKLLEDRFGLIAFLRIYQGRLLRGDTIFNMRTGSKMKVGRLLSIHADQLSDLENAVAGDIVAMAGLDCISGDSFTDGRLRVCAAPFHVPEPVISIAIEPERSADANRLSAVLGRFVREDPTLRIRRDRESGQLLLDGMGELHLSVYLEKLREEVNCPVKSGQPEVAYREQITRRAAFDVLHKKQTGSGQGEYARLIGFIEPMESAEGEFEFRNATTGGLLTKEYASGSERGFREQMQSGMLIGAPVRKLRVVITDAANHAVDSSELAFRNCARECFRQAYMHALPVAMEPQMHVQITVPPDFQSSVMVILNQRKALIENVSVERQETRIEASVPLRLMFGFATPLRSVSRGHGQFSMQFKRYAQMHVQNVNRLSD